MKRDGVQSFQTVGHVELRRSPKKIVDQMRRRKQPVALTNRNQVEAVIMPADRFDELNRSEEELERLRSSIPLIIAAIRTRTAIPFESVGYLIGHDLSTDWERMNAFQAQFPVASTHDEDGRPLSASRSLAGQPFEELDEELRYG